MNTNRNNRSTFSSETYKGLAAVALSAPSNQRDFVSACERAGVLDLIAAEHDLNTIRQHQLEEEFEAHLDEAFEPVLVASCYEYAHSRVLKQVDMVAYREMLREYADSAFVEHANGHFRIEELDTLDRMDVLDTLTKHVVAQFALSDEQADDLSSADTPQEYVNVLKRLRLTEVARAAAGTLDVGPNERRPM